MVSASKTIPHTFSDHFQELRTRLLWCALTFITGSILGYFVHTHILAFLIAPLQKPLYYSSPAGGFDFLLKLCMFFGALVSLPIFVFHLLKFISPIITRKTKYFLLKYLIASLLLMVIGIAFAYYISLPAALTFLSTFGSGQIQSLISTNEYFSFVMRYVGGFALLFQLPLLLVAVNTIKPLPPKKLIGYLKYVIAVSFLIAAIITPTPDIFNQTLMAVPIILLYSISIVVIYIINKPINKRSSRF